MAVYIARRTTRDGKARFHVRFQLSRYSPQVHLGAYRTRAEADARKRWAELEVAAGRIPDRSVIGGRVRAPRVTLAHVAEAWLATRIDIEAETRRVYASRLTHALDAFGDRDPATLTQAEVQAWIIGMRGKPLGIRKRVEVLRVVLEHAGVAPAWKLRLPKQRIEMMRLPTRDQIAGIYAAIPAKHAAVLRLIEATGLRVTSACALAWSDYDATRDRLWVADKTPAGRRWVQLGGVPEHMQVRRQYVVTLGVFPERPLVERRRVFPGATRAAVGNAMMRACLKAGLPHFTPHDLRHLHASRLLADGWSPADVAARLGHAHPGITLRTYAHVVPPD